MITDRIEGDVMRFLTAGETGLVVEFGDCIDERVNAQVTRLNDWLNGSGQLPGIVETIPTYRSLMVVFEPQAISRESLTAHISAQVGQLTAATSCSARRIRVPVCYGGEFGPDLADVASHAGLPMAEVIARHSSPHYLVYMIGFLPGFPYLGGLDKSIACPRLTAPRTHIAAGSVGIAGEQTGIYPIESPGGWRLIGRTPLQLFSGSRQEPFLFRAGDRLQFIPVERNLFDELTDAEQTGALEQVWKLEARDDA